MGLLASGLATYVFLSIASHNLSEQDYSALGVLWSLLFAVGNGLMQPLEQEVARAVSHRRALGHGSAPVIKRAAILGLAFTTIVIALALVFHSFLIDTLFDGQTNLLYLFLLGMVGFCLSHLVRGTLSSHGQFRSYGILFATEGGFRLVLAGTLAAVGVAAVGAYGFIAVLATFAGAAVGVRGQRHLLTDGPEAPWSELSSNLGWLLLGVGSIAIVLNAGPIAVQMLAGPDEEQAAGVFLNALNLVRVPLFLFQAVLASLLPKLSHQLGRGAFDEFASALSRLLWALLALGIVVTLGAAVAGPAVVGLIFGSTEVLTNFDFAILAASASVFIVAAALSQALVALSDHARMAVGALVSLVVMIGVIALGNDLYLRVEMGLLASTTVMAVWMGVCVWLGVRARHTGHIVDLAEELAELPMQP